MKIHFFFNDYYPYWYKDGDLIFWKPGYSRNGNRAGHYNKKTGYFQVYNKLTNVKRGRHREIFDMFYGCVTDTWHIDHIVSKKNSTNGVPVDKIENLQMLKPWDNYCKRALENVQSNNTSTVTGVVWLKREGKWRASRRINRVNVRLGDFDTFEEAKSRVEWSIANPEEALKIVPNPHKNNILPGIDWSKKDTCWRARDNKGRNLRCFNDRKWLNPWWEAVCARKSWEVNCLYGGMSLTEWKLSRGYPRPCVED